MRVRESGLLALVAFLAVSMTAFAQYGHPLKGSWSGEWGANDGARTHVLIALDWDGQTVTGALNPGPDAIPLKVDLDPATWMVRMEAETKDDAGGMVHYVIEGKLENIGSPNRQISGTWMQGSMKGDFTLNRN